MSLKNALPYSNFSGANELKIAIRKEHAVLILTFLKFPTENWFMEDVELLTNPSGTKVPFASLYTCLEWPCGPQACCDHWCWSGDMSGNWLRTCVVSYRSRRMWLLKAGGWRWESRGELCLTNCVTLTNGSKYFKSPLTLSALREIWNILINNNWCLNLSKFSSGPATFSS